MHKNKKNLNTTISLSNHKRRGQGRKEKQKLQSSQKTKNNVAVTTQSFQNYFECKWTKISNQKPQSD